MIALLSIICAGIVYADQGVPAVPETQGLVTETNAQVTGVVTETDAAAWTLTNDPFALLILTNPEGSESIFPDAMLQQLVSNGGSYTTIEDGGDVEYTGFTIPASLLNQQVAGFTAPYLTWSAFIALLKHGGFTETDVSGGIHAGALDPGQVQYTTTYDASIVAQSGATSFIKSMNLNTGNKLLSQSNIDAKTGLTFIATGDGGNVGGTENLLLDGAAMSTTASDRMLCPFAAVNNSVIPAYCNIIQMGGAYDLTVGSVTTEANNRFVGTDATTPVVQNYNIDVKPYGTTSGQIPAMGSAMAYIKTHIQEARGQDAVNYSRMIGGETPSLISWMVYPPPAKAEDISYSETSSASGTISTFSKSMSYLSQARSIPLNRTNVYIPPVD
jgi:hypothetical protein